MASRRWPFTITWHKGLWRAWDMLTTKERRDYERNYEQRRNDEVAAKIRGLFAKRRPMNKGR
jgi:hypothetical protein